MYKTMSEGFESLGLSSNIINGCNLIGYSHPYRLHKDAIPVILSGRDVVVMAPSCSARILCFVAPILDNLNRQRSINSIRALILTPTKDLAHEIVKLVRALAQFTGLRIGLLVGDNKMESLFEELTLQNPDVMIATPDNLIRHLSHVKDMLLQDVECIVLDEADCLLSLGFAKHLRQILPHINQNHQTLIFLDDIPRALLGFVKSVTQDARIVRHHNQITSTLKLIFFTLSEEEKSAALLYLINERIRCDEKTLLFVPTEVHAEFLKLMFMDQGIEPSICYRSMGSHERILQVSRFKTGKSMLLITTDIGYDMMITPSVDNIINWDFPCSPKRFLSRLRTTAVAGPGTAFSFVTREDIPYVLNFRIFLMEELMAAPTEEQIMRDGDTVEVVSEIDQANARAGEILYGKLPPIKAYIYADMVRKLFDASAELKSMERFCADTVDLLTKYKRKYGVEYF